MLRPCSETLLDHVTIVNSCQLRRSHFAAWSAVCQHWGSTAQKSVWFDVKTFPSDSCSFVTDRFSRLFVSVLITALVKYPCRSRRRRSSSSSTPKKAVVPWSRSSSSPGSTRTAVWTSTADVCSNKPDSDSSLASLSSETSLHFLCVTCAASRKSSLGWTALHMACYFGHREVVEELLKVRAAPNWNANGHALSCVHTLHRGA